MVCRENLDLVLSFCMMLKPLSGWCTGRPDQAPSVWCSRIVWQGWRKSAVWKLTHWPCSQKGPLYPLSIIQGWWFTKTLMWWSKICAIRAGHEIRNCCVDNLKELGWRRSPEHWKLLRCWCARRGWSTVWCAWWHFATRLTEVIPGNVFVSVRLEMDIM